MGIVAGSRAMVGIAMGASVVIVLDIQIGTTGMGRFSTTHHHVEQSLEIDLLWIV